MDDKSRGILGGMCLGDAYLNVRVRRAGNCEYTSAEMRIVHSLSQADYCQHKANLVRKILGGTFQVHAYANGPGGNYRCLAFSVSNAYFKTLKRWIYPGGTKKITRFVLDMLTPEGIAIWYMDDGHARRNINKDGWVSSASSSIATMCSRSEIEDVVSWFWDRHQIRFSARFDKRMNEGKNWFIEANTENSRYLAQLIQGYVIPSMRYKLSHVADLNSHERRAPIGQCATCEASIYDRRWGGLCPCCYSRRYYERKKPRAMR